MYEVFSIPWHLRIKRIYIPAVKPFFFSAICTSSGLAVKAGIAAEVVAYIPFSIGKNLADAKSYMEPADLFAWTAVIVILSLVIEKALRAFISAEGRRRADDKNN
jgi:NitT/TauT family transport system permease protein